MMDEREKYSASAPKLEQIPHVEATTEHLKANLNSSAPSARPPGSSGLLENLNRIAQKRTHSFQPGIEITNKQSSEKVASSPCKHIPSEKWC